MSSPLRHTPLPIHSSPVVSAISSFGCPKAALPVAFTRGTLPLKPPLHQANNPFAACVFCRMVFALLEWRTAASLCGGSAKRGVHLRCKSRSRRLTPGLLRYVFCVSAGFSHEYGSSLAIYEPAVTCTFRRLRAAAQAFAAVATTGRWSSGTSAEEPRCGL